MTALRGQKVVPFVVGGAMRTRQSRERLIFPLGVVPRKYDPFNTTISDIIVIYVSSTIHQTRFLKTRNTSMVYYINTQ